MACPFLDKTPLKIRNKIYSYLLSTQYTKQPVNDDKKPSRVKQGLKCSHFYDFQPAILLTNKEINKEARRFLYDDNLFVLVRYHHDTMLGPLWQAELTLLAAGDDEVCSFWSAPRVSMHVDLSIQGKEDLRFESRIVIAANELPVICRILKKLDNGMPGLLYRLRLVLKIFPFCQLDVDAFVNMGPSGPVSWEPRSLPQQRRLLEPFATLHSMPNLEITDMVGKTQYIDAQLMEDVKERASRPPYSMKEVLDISAKINEQGSEAFRAGDFALANSLYESAFESLEAGERYLDKDTGDPGYTEQMYFEAHFLLAFRIWSNSVAALLRLQQWMAAHERATVVIEKIKAARREISFDPCEVAKLHYRRALASEGTGKMARAVEEVREALCLYPKSTIMKAKLKELELQAKSQEQEQVQAALEALTMSWARFASHRDP